MEWIPFQRRPDSPSLRPSTRKWPKSSQDNQPTIYELELIARDGHTVPIELSSRLIFHDGVPVDLVHDWRNERLRHHHECRRPIAAPRGSTGVTMRWRGFLEDAVEMARPPQQTSSDRTAGDARTDLDLEAATERLREERDEVRARLAIMTRDLESLFAASADSNADDEHDPEGQTIAYERSQLSALIQGAQEHLDGIEAATTRLQQGSYGICEVCHQPIPAARLDARPIARTCVRHVAPVRG